MSVFSIFRRTPPAPTGRPWIEFPNAVDDSPVNTLERICMKSWSTSEKAKLVEVEGQGVGSRADSYDVQCICLYRRIVFFDIPISKEELRVTLQDLAERGLKINLINDGCGLDLTNEDPKNAALVMNLVFLNHLKIKPYSPPDHYNIAAY